jgi:regulatory protein
VPTVTGLKPQRNGKRVNVYLDGKFGFGIDLDNLVKNEIKIEKEFSEEEIAKIIKKAQLAVTYEKLLRFASLRPRSEREVNGWLTRKKVHQSLHKELFNRLKHLELIDDTAFAKWWIEQRQAFRPKGKRGLEAELRQKGISREIITEILAETPLNEEKVARDLIEKKAYKWKNLPAREAKIKKSRYLAGKGFSWETIEKVLTKR